MIYVTDDSSMPLLNINFQEGYMCTKTTNQATLDCNIMPYGEPLNCVINSKQNRKNHNEQKRNK